MDNSNIITIVANNNNNKKIRNKRIGITKIVRKIICPKCLRIFNIHIIKKCLNILVLHRYIDRLFSPKYMSTYRFTKDEKYPS